ncbi:MAG: hypothetical protein AAF289_09010 [Cyanobacteria bacterium P01_A01_bin.135]
MNYVIAIFASPTAAQAAQETLTQNRVAPEQITVVERDTPIDPELQFLGIQQRPKYMTYWLVPFGFIGGYAFNLSTQYDLVASLGPQGNHLVGGLLGAVAGFVGSLFTGSNLTLFGKTSGPSYAKQLKQGKVLVVVKGAPNVTNKAKSLLRQLESEEVESYVVAG